MSELVRWEVDGEPIVVEVAEQDAEGFQAVGIGGHGIIEAKSRFEDSLRNVRDAATRVLDSFRDKQLNPDEVELEFGVKFNAAAGAVVAKASTEGHFIVKLTWARQEK
ncbi:CU044_2847 family protein [Microbispora sp. H10830]|uniref:CU044_2847 family protein n=1 Tax=Microbispora sp. H10830 TaxID=2729109 RepID=UPI001C71990D|nr:CU044_2847 family protein [Microbispora sp. H10830]